MIEDGTPTNIQKPIITVTDRLKNGDMSDPVYSELVSLLSDNFNLTPEDVFITTGEVGHVRIFKKLEKIKGVK